MEKPNKDKPQKDTLGCFFELAQLIIALCYIVKKQLLYC